MTFYNCVMKMCSNRGCLTDIGFDPALRVDKQHWVFADALRLEKVTNGEAILYSRQQQHPRSALRDAIDHDDGEMCCEILASGMSRPSFKDDTTPNNRP